MPRDLFESILQQVKGLTKLLHFHVVGEPLLHPEIAQFLDLNEVYNYRVNLVTNGHTLSTIGHTLFNKPALRLVSVSIQSALALSEDAFHRYLESIRQFTNDSRLHNGPAICLRLWHWGPEDSEADSIHLMSEILEIFQISNLSPKDLLAEKGTILGEKLSLSMSSRFSWPTLNGPDFGPQGSCLGLREQLAILVDGTVVPCCLDAQGTMSLGNVRDQTVRQILAGPKAQTIRNGFQRGNITQELCRRCSYRLRF